jgi:hypothetical protein
MTTILDIMAYTKLNHSLGATIRQIGGGTDYAGAEYFPKSFML